MKTVKLILIVPVLLLLSFRAPAPGITSAERKAALGYLETTQADFLKSIKGLTAEQLSFKATPESWSIAECAEHIAITETNLFGMMQGTLKEAANPAKRSEVKLTDEQIFAAISDRSFKVKTQEPNEPTKKFGSHEATVKEFLAKRKSNMDYVKPPPMICATISSPSQWKHLALPTLINLFFSWQVIPKGIRFKLKR